jgi:DNA polymerase III delta subunit
MLKVVTGKDFNKIKQEANKLANDFLKSNKNSVIENHTADTLTASDLEYRALATSLFGDLKVFIIEDFIKEYTDEFVKIVEILSTSKNLFIFYEESVIKDVEKSITGASGGFVKLDAPEKAKENPFAITDALVARDKKKLWQLYRQEIDRGESAESIMGRFVWAIKTLVLIQKNPKDTALTLGISPFVYSKTKTQGLAWTGNDAENFYTNMLFGMKPGDEMEHHLEKLILG